MPGLGVPGGRGKLGVLGRGVPRRLLPDMPRACFVPESHHGGACRVRVAAAAAARLPAALLGTAVAGLPRRRPDLGWVLRGAPGLRRDGALLCLFVRVRRLCMSTWESDVSWTSPAWRCDSMGHIPCQG